MTFSDHAIKKYKKRILKKRTTSRKRIISLLHKELSKDIKSRKPAKIRGHYILITSKFQAVCFGHHVITILKLDADAENMTMKNLREEMEISA